MPDNKLEKRPSKRGIFVASCADIANTLESRLRSELIKREEHKTVEVMILKLVLDQIAFKSNIEY